MFGFENLQIASEKSSFDFFPVSICIYPCIRTVKEHVFSQPIRHKLTWQWQYRDLSIQCIDYWNTLKIKNV